MLSSLSTEDLIPKDHPIRRIRKVVDEVLAEMDGEFDAIYSRIDRQSSTGPARASTAPSTTPRARIGKTENGEGTVRQVVRAQRTAKEGRSWQPVAEEEFELLVPLRTWLIDDTADNAR